MKVVVLGGNTALGSYVCPHLVQSGHSVTCISDTDEEPYNYTNNAAWQDVTQIVLDRRTTEAVAEGQYGKKVADLKPEVIIDTNCYYLEHCRGLMQALRGTKVQLMIHCGTLHVYSPTQSRPWLESAKRGYSSGLFAAHQQQMEKFLKEENETGSIPICTLLLGTLIGRGWLPITCQGTYDALVLEAMQTGGTVMLPEQSRSTIQVVHGEDAAAVVKECIEQRAAVQGEVFNVAGYPMTLQDYAAKLPQILQAQDQPALKERGWWEFSRALANFDYDKAMQATYTVFHCAAASNVKVIQALGVKFRDPLVAVKDAVEWMKENPEKAEAPRIGKHWDFLGLDGKEFDEVDYLGERPGYIYRDGKDGKGYYVDNGPFVNWQKQSIRRIKLEHDRITMQEGFTRKDIYLFVGVATLWVLFFFVLLLWSDTAQGMVVFQGFMSGIGGRVPPRPFTKHLMLNSTDTAKIGVWHNALPVGGYLDKPSEQARRVAAQACKTVVYFHGSAENRITELDKMAWYMNEVGAHVVTMDYRGFGDGQCPTKAFTPCPTEVGVYEDAFTVYEYLTKPIAEEGLGIHPSCLVFHGHGLGSAIASRVAVELFKKGKSVGGVILEAPFTSAWDWMRHSSYFPLKYMPDFITDLVEAVFKPNLKPRFVQSKWIADFALPVLFLHGENDKLVPPHMSTSLYKKRTENVEEQSCGSMECTEIVSVPEAGHRDVMKNDHVKAKVADFVSKAWKAGQRL